MSEYTPTIVHLPGTRLTPDVVLHRTLAKCAHIKSVCIVIQWGDDTFDIDWSQQKVSELCMGALLLHDTAVKTAKNPDYT